MTIAEWLEQREPGPPESLAASLRSALGPALEANASEAPERFLSAAESLLSRLLASGLSRREAAMDLLAVDALVTYAFEAGADDPAGLRQNARDAMHRIAALVVSQA